MPPRLCLVGYGAIARHHAEIVRAEGAVLRSVVGRLPEETARFAAEFGFRHHTTDLADALADDQLDAVIIGSPSALHYSQARLALLAGKHVLAEVPLAMSYKEGEELVALAAEKHLCLMVAQSERYIPALAAIRRKVGEGQLRVLHLIGRFGLFRRENVGWTGRQRSWTDNILWHHGGHLVDFALWLFGAKEARLLTQTARPDPRTGIPMDLDILLQISADQVASLSLTYHSRMHFLDYLIVGEEDTIHFANGRTFGGDGLRDDAETGGSGHLRLSWEAQDREFLAALRERRPPGTSGSDVLPALRILQSIQDQLMPSLAEQSPG
jgi:2-hydroxy-4-carboxymuconate semialdehyde hemiacetal dehydrogenase